MTERLEFELRLNSVNTEPFQLLINKVRNFVTDVDNWKFIVEMDDDEIERVSIKLSEKFELDNKITELVIRNEIYLIRSIGEIIDENLNDATYRVEWNK